MKRNGKVVLLIALLILLAIQSCAQKTIKCSAVEETSRVEDTSHAPMATVAIAKPHEEVEGIRSQEELSAKPLTITESQPPLTSPAESLDTPPTESDTQHGTPLTEGASPISYGHVAYVGRPSQHAKPKQTAINLDDYTKLIENQLNSFEPGHILFNPSGTMTVGIKEIINVRIAKQINEQFMQGLSGRGVAQIENIKVGTFMKAHLGGDNFDIQMKSSSEEQTISNDGFTPWEWEVTPKEGGSQTLLLTVTVRLKLPNGKEEIKDYPVFRRPIVVAVNPLYTTTEFVEKYWQWLITFLIIPPVGFFYKRKFDSKQ